MFFEQYGFHEIANFQVISGDPDPMLLIYRFFSCIMRFMHRAYRIYFFELSMYYIVSILVLIAILTLYYMYFALDELKIREKSANVFYDSLFLKTKVVEKVTKTRKVKKNY